MRERVQRISGLPMAYRRRIGEDSWEAARACRCWSHGTASTKSVHTYKEKGTRRSGSPLRKGVLAVRVWCSCVVHGALVVMRCTSASRSCACTRPLTERREHTWTGPRACRNLIVPVCYVVLGLEVNQALFVSVMLDIFNCTTVTWIYTLHRKVSRHPTRSCECARVCSRRSGPSSPASAGMLRAAVLPCCWVGGGGGRGCACACAAQDHACA